MKLLWPRSRWAHAGLALVFAGISAAVVFSWVEKTRFALYVREYPHDGLDGLAAFSDALNSGAWTLLCVFVLAFVLQSWITKLSQRENRK